MPNPYAEESARYASAEYNESSFAGPAHYPAKPQTTSPLKNGQPPRKEVNKMKAVVFTTKNTAYVREFDAPMIDTAEKVVGDWVELVRPKGLPGYLMLVNENGLPRELPINIAGSLFYGTPIHGSPIVGDIVIAADNIRKDPQGLTDNQIDFVIAQAQHLAKLYGCEIRLEDPNEHP